jgi:hypothetical protein
MTEIASRPSAFAKASADKSAAHNDGGFKPYYVAYTKGAGKIIPNKRAEPFKFSPL